jgi:hypothetical protein
MPGTSCAEIPIAELVQRGKAGELHASATLPMGDGSQTADELSAAQSGTAGLPERLCRANMKKNMFVLGEMGRILASLTRGLELDVLSRGHGEERGVPISMQAESPVLGLVLPSNSPGVHTLWLPVIPMQIGLVLKPGPQEPWTPYRMAGGVLPGGRAYGSLSDLPRRRRCRCRGARQPQRSLTRRTPIAIGTRESRRMVPASEDLLGDDQVITGAVSR